MDGIEFFGVNNGEACIPLWLKKGTKLTTRSGEGFSYVVRCVFQHSLSQLNYKLGFWGGLNQFDVGFYGTNDNFALEFGFVSVTDNRKMILIFNKYGIELQFLNSDNTNRRTIWKMTAKQHSLSRIKFERIDCIVDGGKIGVYEIKHDAQYCFSNAMSSLKYIRTQIKTQDNKMLLYVFNDGVTQWRGSVSILYFY